MSLIINALGLAVTILGVAVTAGWLERNMHRSLKRAALKAQIYAAMPEGELRDRMRHSLEQEVALFWGAEQDAGYQALYLINDRTRILQNLAILLCAIAWIVRLILRDEPGWIYDAFLINGAVMLVAFPVIRWTEWRMKRMEALRGVEL